MKKTLLALLLLSLVMPAASCAEAPREVVLSFAGDCTLGSMSGYEYYEPGFIQTILREGMEHPFSGVKEIFAADDLTLVNLEGAFTEQRKGQEDKKFLFRAPPAFAEILALGSVECVNIANNHIRDFFEQGRLDTIDALTAQGIAYAGDGALAVLDAGGVRVGITGYSYPHRKTLEKLKEDIALLRKRGCDIIILSMHAGTEESYKVNLTQKETARGAIDLGVDIVVGHHPHVVQGIEVYQGKPILYSLGNFAFGGNHNPKDWDTFIGQVVLEADADGVRLKEMRILPCRISEAERLNDFRPVPATEAQAEEILRKMGWSSVGVDEETLKSRVIPLGETPGPAAD